MNEKKFVVVYDNLFYTKKEPNWGVQFTPHLHDAELFTEKQAKEVCRDLHNFKGICYRVA